MNPLTEYIKNMRATRQFLKEARIKMLQDHDRHALKYVIEAFDSFVKATSCALSIREKKKPRRK